MTIHDSWQDRERERKRIYAQYRSLSPSHQRAMWDLHCQEVLMEEMARLHRETISRLNSQLGSTHIINGVECRLRKA